MTTLRVLVPLLGLFAFSADVGAAFRPSFDSRHCAWTATHVVVVTEGDAIDGVVTVLESWKGDLEPGDVLAVPELAAFASDESRAIAEPLFGTPRTAAQRMLELPTRPARVTGSRMVLFLVKKAEAGQVAWGTSSHSKRMDVSVAWVEAGKVYAFGQRMDPGPSELLDFQTGERWLRWRVAMAAGVQAELRRAAAVGDPNESAARVLRLMTPEFLPYRHLAIGTLGDSGPGALPALRAVLADAALSGQHEAAVVALARAGGAAAGPELAAMLAKELRFWRRVGPGLAKGWTWGDSDEAVRHYLTTRGTLKGLKETHPPACRDAVAGLRDLWRSLPQLTDQKGIASACDAILAELDRAPAPPR